MEIISTRNINSEEVANLQRILVEISEAEVKATEIFMKSADPPEYVRIVAELFTWSNVFKVSATAFLAKIGSLAAEDAWSSKGRIKEALRENGLERLKIVAAALARIKSSSPSGTDVLFSIPVPNDFPGTNLKCPATSEEEIAVYLACFALRADEIVERIQSFKREQDSDHIAAHLLLEKNGTFVLTVTEFMKGIEAEYRV